MNGVLAQAPHYDESVWSQTERCYSTHLWRPSWDIRDRKQVAPGTLKLLLLAGNEGMSERQNKYEGEQAYQGL